MRKLDIGTGRKHFEDFETLDVNPDLGCDHALDVSDPENLRHFNQAFDEIRAFHILEHVRPELRVATMTNLHNWLKVGGTFEIEVPIAGTEQYYQDPTHLAPWTPATFWYFTKGNKFGEAFAKRSCGSVLFELVTDAVVNDWKYYVKFRRVI